jgi:hypothetical protein
MVDVLGRRRMLDGDRERGMVVALCVSTESMEAQLHSMWKMLIYVVAISQYPFLLSSQVYLFPMAIASPIRGQSSNTTTY